MSVLKRMRSLSKYEYTKEIQWINQYMIEKLKKVSKRKVKWICEPIYSVLREVTILASDTFYESFETCTSLFDMQDQANAIIDSLMDLQKPLFTLWNIEEYSTREMVYYVGLVNTAIENISKNAQIERGDRKLIIIDYKALERAKFLKTLSKLHKTIHSKIISIPRYARDSEGVKLADLADNALYYAYKSNSFIPKTKEGYYIRRKGMKTAMKCLKDMDAPLFGFFNLMGYSENTMLELANLLDDSQKLLQSIIKSDEKQFSALE